MYYTGVDMDVVLRKFGNSTGVAFPVPVLRSLGLVAGQVLELRTDSDGSVTLTPKVPRSKCKYTLAQLLAQCDPSAPPSPGMAEWDAAKPVGTEVL